jgi:hypothetical protein
MNLNPFARRRRSLQPRGDTVLRRIDETGNPVSEPESTSTNYPVLGQLWASRQGANIIAHTSRLPSSESPPNIPRSPDDPSANRLGPDNVTVIAGMRRPDPLPLPKPEEVCARCHFPVPGGHAGDCSYWNFLAPGTFPDDY